MFFEKVSIYQKKKYVKYTFLFVEKEFSFLIERITRVIALSNILNILNDHCHVVTDISRIFKKVQKKKYDQYDDE